MAQPSTPPTLLVFLVLAVLLSNHGVNAQQYQLLINSTTSMASATSDYSFEIQQEDDLNFTSTTSVQITLPADYQGIMSDGPFTCYISQWISGATVNPITCNLLGLTFTISGAFTGIVGTLTVPAYTIFAFVINQLTNPMYAVTTAAFTGVFTNTATNTPIFIFNTNFGINGIQITQGSLDCVVTSSTTTTTSSSGMILSITPTIMIPYNTTITIQMQKYWTTNAVNSTLILSSVSCQSGTNTTSNIQCGLIIKPTVLQITVANVVAADVHGTIQFYVYSINNPPTIEPQGSIDIITKKDGNKIMARCSGNKMTGIRPINFISASYLVTNYSVNAITSAFLVVKINSMVIASDSIQITLPPTITAVNVLTYVVLTNGNVPNYSPTVTYNPTTFETTIKTNGSSSNSGTTIEVQLYNVKNPPSQATTTSIGVAIKRNSYQMEQLDTISTPLLFEARRGAITGVLSISTTEVGVQADYTISIQLTNQISSSPDSLIIVYFPSMFSSSVTGSSTCVPACQSLTSTKAVFLASSVTSLTTNSLSCTLKLMSLTNPLQVGTTTSLTINTQLYGTNADSIVDQLTSGLTVNLTSREITTISVSSNSAVVYNYPTTFTIASINNNPIPAYSSLLITLPAGISVQETQISCLLGVRSVPCTYNSTTRTITITSITTLAIAAGALPSVYLLNIFNPTSTMPTSTFKFYILNSFSQTIEYKESGLTYSASSPATFSTITLTPNTVTNSYGSTSLAISFSLNFDDGYVNNSLLVINLPSQVSNVGLTTCTPTSSNLQSIVCTKSATTIKAKLVFSSLAAGVEVSYRIQFYINYPSIQPYDILVTLYMSNLEQYKIAQETVTKVNSVLSPITINSFSFSNGILSQSTILTVSITPTYTGSDLSEVWVTLPSEFTVTSGACSSLPSGLSCTVAGNVYKIIESSASYAWTMPLQFSLTGITAPSYTPSTSATIQSKSASGYLISRDISIRFSTSCTLPCRTCSPTDSTSCISCYSNPELVSSKTMLSGTQCVSACANRLYFNNNTGQCDTCSSLCELCIDYSYCTSCPTGIYLYRYNHTCVSSCPFGYYPSTSYTCQACSSALFCASCSNEYQCLTCLTGYFFYQTLCMQNCPAPTTYSNSILKTCENCPTNCTKCTGSVTASSSNVACTQCSPGYLLDTSTQRCFLECLVPGTVPNGNQCVGCQTPCLTCSATSTNCTSCDTSSSSVNQYLHNNRCLSICPSLYYPSNSSYTCILCTSPCETCTSGSINSCISCIAGTYLQGTSCVSSCPNLYYTNVYQCTACSPPCLNCISELQCTSCVSGKYLYGSNCVSACDPGMTVINGNQCLVCASSCKTCSTSTYCTTCYPTNYLYNGTCSILCPNGTYRDNTQQICVACTSPCLECSSSNYCISCINTALFVENGACVAACSGNLIPVNSMCTACNVVCTTCSVSITNCVRCASNYYYVYSNTTIPNCVASCTSGYIYDNRVATNNYECLQTCPAQYYATGLGTSCLPCDTGCYSCTNVASNCSSCLSSYYLYSNTTSCTQTCPISAPYPAVYSSPTSGRCQICNMSICATCEMIGSCASCLTSGSLKLLVYEGVTSRLNISSENKTCISVCPTGYTYSASSWLCNINSINTTNNTNSTTNNTTTPTSTWTYKLIPNYLFSIISVCFLPIVAISKYQMPHTNAQISMYVLFAMFATASLAHVLYFEGQEIFNQTSITYTSTASNSTRLLASSSDYITLANLRLYVQNPTTILSLVALGLHVLGTVVLLISLACTRDYSLIPIIHSHPIFSLLLLLFVCVEYKIIWILNSALFGAEVLMVKYCQISTVRILKVITVIGLTQLIMEVVYGVYVLVLSLNVTPSARLLLSNSSVPSSITYLHPYIQLIIMSSLTIFLTICVLTTKQQEYFIEKVPELAPTFLQSKLSSKKQTKKTNNLSENNESMNQLLSEKDAAFRRFSTDDIYRDIDESNMIVSADSDYLHDFGVGTNQPVGANNGEPDILNSTKKSSTGKISKMSHRSSRTNKTQKSKMQIQKAEVDVQVNLDEMLLPHIEEEDQNQQFQKPYEVQGKNEMLIDTEKKEEQIVPIVSILQSNQKQDDKSKELLEQKNPVSQEDVQLKSQPSWSSFKLGKKYKQQIVEEEYMGYICRTGGGQGQEGMAGHSSLLDQHGEKVTTKATTKSPEVKNNRMKVIELDSEQEQIDEIVEDEEQQYIEDDVVIPHNKDSRLHIITNRIEEESQLQSISQHSFYYQEQQPYHTTDNQFNPTSNPKTQTLTYREEQSSHMQEPEEEYEQQIQLARPNTQSIKSKSERPKTETIKQKSETVISNHQTQSRLNLNQHQSGNEEIEVSILSDQSSAMVNDPQQLKRTIRNNIFYHQQDYLHEQLLSENIPDEYKVREPSQESEPFEQFKMSRGAEEKECLIDQPAEDEFGYEENDSQHNQEEENQKYAKTNQEVNQKQQGKILHEIENDEGLKKTTIQPEKQQEIIFDDDEENNQQEEELKVEQRQEQEQGGQEPQQQQQKVEEVEEEEKQEQKEEEEEKKEEEEGEGVRIEVEVEEQKVIGNEEKLQENVDQLKLNNSIKQNQNVIDNKEINERESKKRQQKNPQSLLALLKSKRTIKKVTLESNEFQNSAQLTSSKNGLEHKKQYFDPPERDISSHPLNESSEIKNKQVPIDDLLTDKNKGDENQSLQNQHQNQRESQQKINNNQQNEQIIQQKSLQQSLKKESLRESQQPMKQQEIKAEQDEEAHKSQNFENKMKNEKQQIKSTIKSKKSEQVKSMIKSNKMVGQQESMKGSIRVSIQSNKQIQQKQQQQKGEKDQEDNVKDTVVKQSSKISGMQSIKMSNKVSENQQELPMNENKNLLKGEIEMIRKHRPQRSQILQLSERKQMQKDNEEDKQQIQRYIEREQTEHFTEINKNRKTKRIQIEYDDAEHFNEHKIRDEDPHYSTQQIIYRAPSEMGASLLIVHDDTEPAQHEQEQEKSQLSQEREYEEIINTEERLTAKQQSAKQQTVKQQSIKESEHKQHGITFIEDLNQLDEIVKTPIRMITTKSKAKPKPYYTNQQQQDTKPSEFIYNKKPINSNPMFVTPDGNQSNRSIPGKQQTPARLLPQHNPRNTQNNKNTKIETKRSEIIYEEEDTQYQGEANWKKSNQKGIPRYNTIGHESERKSSQEKPSDQKPSTILRGSFKKIGEILMKGNQEK